jgi:hypothetical protein
VSQPPGMLPGMSDPKDDLHRYLRAGREALLWKLDAATPYDRRRPLTPTGTSLLGLVKHVAGVEAEYFGLVFDRPFPESLSWMDDPQRPNADMYADENESTGDILDFARRAWAHADATIEALGLDAVGRVPWWGERGEVTLHRILVHVATEVHRHAGHADIVRELIDGAAGLRSGATNLPDLDWVAYRERLERIARAATD